MFLLIIPARICQKNTRSFKVLAGHIIATAAGLAFGLPNFLIFREVFLKRDSVRMNDEAVSNEYSTGRLEDLRPPPFMLNGARRPYR